MMVSNTEARTFVRYCRFFKTFSAGSFSFPAIRSDHCFTKFAFTSDWLGWAQRSAGMKVIVAMVHEDKTNHLHTVLPIQLVITEENQIPHSASCIVERSQGTWALRLPISRGIITTSAHCVSKSPSAYSTAAKS